MDRDVSQIEFCHLYGQRLRNGVSPPILVSFIIWDDGVMSASLNTRGWVLQERLLSPRVVHFARNQVFWECRHQQACESCPEGMRYAFDYLSSKPTDAYIIGFVPGARLADYPAGGYAWVFRDYWRLVVARYSMCELTFQTDKVVALSGIAQHLGIHQEDYYVGMERPVTTFFDMESQRRIHVY